MMISKIQMNAILAGALFVTSFAAQSKAAQLECKFTFKKSFTREVVVSRYPLMTAEIVSNQRLRNFEINTQNYHDYMEKKGAVLKDHQGTVSAEAIQDGRSPYKGMNRFKVPGIGDVILPRNLSIAALKAAYKGAPGLDSNENSVIITTFDHGGDGAGNHVSYRLSCDRTN